MFRKPTNPWWTVAAGALGAGFGIGIFIIYVLGVLTKPMAADLGLDRSVISFSLSCFLATTAIGTITLGILIHRFGVRGPAFVYLAGTVCCVALIPLLPPTPLAFYLLFALMGVAGAASTALPYSVAIAGLFDHQRGLALALAVAGGGLGGMLGPQLTNLLLTHLGWREAIWVVAAIMALPLAGLAFLVRSPPAIRDRDPAVKPESHWSLYLGKPAFWLIASAMLGIAAGTFVLAILVPLLTDRGLPAGQAGMVLSTAAFTSLVGRLCVGWLLDRFWAPLVTSLTCLGAFVGLLLVAYGGDALPVIVVGSSLLGVALGAEADLLTYLCSRYFPLRAFSRAVGSMWVVWAWGGGIGTTAAGLAYRASGSYQPAMLVLAGILLLSAVAVLFLGPYPFPPAHSAGGGGRTRGK